MDKHRLTLDRAWDQEAPHYVFIGVNPSTADELIDDQTIRKIEGFCRYWGVGSFRVVNLFTERSTNIKDMKGLNHKSADEILLKSSKQAEVIVACWGSSKKHPKMPKRIRRVMRMLKPYRNKIKMIGSLTQSGDPRHPLMLPYNLPLNQFEL